MKVGLVWKNWQHFKTLDMRHETLETRVKNQDKEGIILNQGCVIFKTCKNQIISSLCVY